MNDILLVTGQPLGQGRMYPAGSLCDPVLAALLASYKTSVAGAYTSVNRAGLPVRAFTRSISRIVMVVHPVYRLKRRFLEQATTKAREHQLPPSRRVAQASALFSAFSVHCR